VLGDPGINYRPFARSVLDISPCQPIGSLIDRKCRHALNSEKSSAVPTNTNLPDDDMWRSLYVGG
jgi:hypothetical protein